jgi:acetyl/propionyl-CoA carboxylase alpha subunit
MVTGLDLVALQLRIAAGEPLPFTQDTVELRGAAIECRITAEDPFAGFVPASGRIALVREPSGPGIRVDSALFSGMTVPSEYDSLLAKVIAYGSDRVEAIARLRRALQEMRIAGIPTSLPFHRAALFEQDFVVGRYDTDFVARWDTKKATELTDEAVAAGALAAVLAMRSRGERRATPVADAAWARAGREDALR